MQEESHNFQIEKEIVWEYPAEGISRQIMGYNPELMLVKVKFETNAVGTPHTHPHTQATYVVCGIFEFTTDGETQVVHAGDGIYIKPGTSHGCRCLEAGILIDAFAPIREDFL